MTENPLTSRLARLRALAAKSDADSLIGLHEEALFLRAFPPDAATLRETGRLLTSIKGRVDRLRAAGDELAASEEPELSGIAGSAFTAIFSHGVARRLAELEPGRIKIDWDRYEITDQLAPAWRRLFPLVEEDLAVEAHIPYSRALRPSHRASSTKTRPWRMMPSSCWTV